MKNANCDCCKDAKFGIAYIDEESGILCVSLEEKYDKPKEKKVLVPFICTTCGETTWKTIDNE